MTPPSLSAIVEEMRHEARKRRQSRLVENLAMIVRMLCHALSKRAPDHSALKTATKFLFDNGLQGSLLRQGDDHG